MQILCSGTATQEVYTAAAQLPGTRAGEQETQTARLDQAVHFVQQFRQTLDLVDDDKFILRAKLLRHAPRILAKSKIDGVIQEIVDARIA
jgi:hypothetical protein